MATNMTRLKRDLERLESAPPLKRRKFPRWLTKKLKSDWNNPLGYTHHGRNAWAICTFESWFDHWGYFTLPSREQIFVVEPYDLDNERMEELMEFAKWADAEFLISPISTHFPGRTVRVMFWQEQETAPRQAPPRQNPPEST